MIHTDGIHLVSDTSFEELHLAATQLGIKRNRYHLNRSLNRRLGWPHYDITLRDAKDLRRLGALGVRLTTTRGVVEAMRNGPMLDEVIAEDRVREQWIADGQP